MTQGERRVFACGNRDRQVISVWETRAPGRGDDPSEWPKYVGLRAKRAKLETCEAFTRTIFEDMVVVGGMHRGVTTYACLFDRVVLKGDLRNLWIRRELYGVQDPEVDPDIVWRWHQSVEYALDITEMVASRCQFDLDIPPDKIRFDPTRQIVVTPERAKDWWEAEGSTLPWFGEYSIPLAGFLATLRAPKWRTEVIFAPGPHDNPRDVPAATHDFALLLASGVGIPP